MDAHGALALCQIAAIDVHSDHPPIAFTAGARRARELLGPASRVSLTSTGGSLVSPLSRFKRKFRTGQRASAESVR